MTTRSKAAQDVSEHAGSPAALASLLQHGITPARLLSTVSEGILVCLPDGTVTYANASAARILGLPLDALLSSSVNSLGQHLTWVDGSPIPDDERPFRQVLQQRALITGIEVAYLRPDGNRIAVRLNAAPLLNDEGNIDAVMIVFAEVTQQKRMEQALQESEETLRALLNATTEIAFLLDREGHILAANETTARQLQLPLEDILGACTFDLFPPETAQVHRLHIEDAIRTGLPVHFEDKRLGNWLSNHIFPILDETGQVTRLAVYARDITRRKEAMQRLELEAFQQTGVAVLGQRALAGIELPDFMYEALEQIEHLLGVDCCDIFEMDAKGTALRITAALGCVARQVETLVIETGGKLLPAATVAAGAPTLIEDWQAERRVRPLPLVKKHGLRCSLSVPIPGRDCCYGVLEAHAAQPASLTRHQSSFLQAIASILGAAIARKHSEEELKYLSTHDGLTALYNRAFFEEEFARLERGRQYPVTIVIVDVDGLKDVNDGLGHQAGDSLLVRTTEVLRASFRSEDLIARMGGDEFVVLLPSSDAQAAVHALARIRENLQVDDLEHPELPLWLSIGAATATAGDSLTGALQRADEMMYREKLVKKATRLAPPSPESAG
ncbi:MAG: sensor domain-containing diguanylate cyclase [Armatimonadota bacterium]